MAADEGHSLDLDELIANCVLLLNAGNETTTCLLANGLGLLLENPDQMELLRAEPERIPNAVEEILRLEGPVQFLGRIATEDVDVGGKTIKAGEMVLTVLGAANRDPDVFGQPDSFDIMRSPLHQLGFVTDPHLCAGIQLARLEAKIAFEALLENVSNIELATEKLVYGKNYNMRCLARLPIRVG